MALTDLLYRCPLCGSDPLPGKAAEARCPTCATKFSAVRGGGVSVSEPGHPMVRRTALELARALALPSGDDAAQETDSSGEPGPPPAERRRPIRETRARVKIATDQTPIRFEGRILGFMEEFGPTRDGVLRLERDALTFQLDSARSTHGVDRWPLDQIRSVQSSSSSVQITTRETGLVSIRVRGESIRLWELLIHRAVQGIWNARGWGRIVEFQPRIRTD